MGKKKKLKKEIKRLRKQFTEEKAQWFDMWHQYHQTNNRLTNQLFGALVFSTNELVESNRFHAVIGRKLYEMVDDKEVLLYSLDEVYKEKLINIGSESGWGDIWVERAKNLIEDQMNGSLKKN